LLKRASIVANEIVPVGKETDRRWEQGEDMSLLDFKVLEYRESGNLVIALPSDRKRWSNREVRKLMRESKLSQKVVYAILNGRPVRRRTLAIFQACCR
jgi:hypothetical protein